LADLKGRSFTTAAGIAPIGPDAVDPVKPFLHGELEQFEK
jgi:hypothetical protein